MEVTYQVRMLLTGMLSTPEKFETAEEADEYARAMRCFPGMVPLVEEVDE